jgi:LacI family transcriptional regulator
MVTGSTTLICGRDRISGYLEALEENGIAVDKRLIFYGNWQPESGRRAFDYFFKLKEQPTAIFCANDHMALGVMRSAKLNGITIPDDLSIFGYNDITYSGFLTPPLTTMKQPLNKIGEMAVDLLVRSINNPDMVREKIMMDTEFIERESCTVPRRIKRIKIAGTHPDESPPELRVGPIYPHPERRS